MAKTLFLKGFQESYIPTWDDECVGFLNEHHVATDQGCRQKATAAFCNNQHLLSKTSSIDTQMVHS